MDHLCLKVRFDIRAMVLGMAFGRTQPLKIVGVCDCYSRSLQSYSTHKSSIVEVNMTVTLILHDVSDDDVSARNRLAALAGKTAEAMHLDILKSALQRLRRRSFADVLLSMPNVGEDADFDSRNLTS